MEYSKSCVSFLLPIIAASQWCQVFVGEMLFWCFTKPWKRFYGKRSCIFLCISNGRCQSDSVLCLSSQSVTGCEGEIKCKKGDYKGQACLLIELFACESIFCLYLCQSLSVEMSMFYFSFHVVPHCLHKLPWYQSQILSFIQEDLWTENHILGQAWLEWPTFLL